jgi:DNA (cytosine-5)-methyltransferase 1
VTVYYNDNDPFAAAWLRELMRAGQLPEGEIDERSVADVRADDLRGFQYCHFFAGIGGWPYALRLAGWPDDERTVWTGSCPCQPFSAAGRGDGAADSRHLWPAWFRLITECRPDVLFGEQVAGVDGLAWFDRVSTDLENADYAVGAADLAAAGVGAPHIRQRLYFVGDTDHTRSQGRRVSRHGSDQRAARPTSLVGELADGDGARRGARGAAEAGDGRDAAWFEPAGLRNARGLADRDPRGRAQQRAARLHERWSEPRSGASAASHDDGPSGDDAARCGALGGMADPGGAQRRTDTTQRRDVADRADAGRQEATSRHELDREVGDSFWSDCDWIPCADGKARPIERGTQPLVTRLPSKLGRSSDKSLPFHPAEARVKRLKGYGNSIVPQVAAAFIHAYLEC